MSGSTGFPFVTGEMPTATQWNTLFSQYALVTGGTLNSPTINTPTISTIISPTPINFVINGSTIPFPGATGPYLPIGGGSLSGTLSQSISPTWSGGFPGTNNIGQYLVQNYSGTPTGHYSSPSGGAYIPFNFINVTETIAFDPPASQVAAMFIRDQYGGTGTTGGRLGLEIEIQNVGPVSSANGNYFYSALQLSNYASYNVTGSTPGSPLGNFYGMNMYISAKAAAADSSPIYLAGLAAMELDYTIEAGGSVHSGVGILISNFSPSGTTEVNDGTGIVIATSHDNTGGGVGFKSHGIHFGNQDGSHTLPVQSTGSLIGAGPGTVVNGADFSNVTFTGQVFKGPNSFGVDNNNTVHTDNIFSATSNGIGFSDTSGNGLFHMARSGSSTTNYLGTNAPATGNAPVLKSISGTDAQVDLWFQTGGTTGTTGSFKFLNGATATLAYIAGVAGAVSYPQLTPAASGNILLDVGGTATGISIGPSVANGVVIGNASATTQILGTLKGAAGTFTANGSVATALSSLGPSGSHTTVQEWLTITDTSGTVRYIPCF